MHWLVACSTVLAGCGIVIPHTPSVSATRQYIDRDFYASQQVQTPDHRAPCYPKGERLVFTWSLPKAWLASSELELQVRWMYRNHERGQAQWPVHNQVGSVYVESLGKEFDRTCGFLTYLVELRDGDHLLLSEPHQLWFEWIEVSDP